MLRLAFCAYRVTPFGGLERNCVELALAARRRGHRVSLFTRRFEGARPEGIEVHELPVGAWTNIGRDRAFVEAARSALERERPDVVVGFNKLPGLDVYYAADPCVAATRAPSPFALPNRRQRAAWERALFAPGAGTECLVLSERERERYREHYGTEEGRLLVLPPGLRAEFLAAGPEAAPGLREELGLPREALVVLAIGSDFARKGLDRTLEALAMLPDAPRERTWLLVVGAGQPGRFGRRARALGLEERVRFAGGRADVLDCYRAADLLVHPAREENTGSVLLEASSQGVPVVCTSECGFAPHIERSRAGRVLSSPLEVEELATCCAELLGDGELRRALGERGREAARAFPMHRRTDAALAVIEAVAEKKRVAGVVPAQAR